MRTPHLLGATALALLVTVVSACGAAGKTTAVTSTTLAAPTTTTATPSTTAASTTATSSAASTTTTTAAAATTTSPPTPTCATDGLTVSVGGATDPGAGSVTYPISFTNRGTAPCVLNGYPGVSAVNARGGQVGQPALRTSRTGSAVVVAPQHATTALLRVAQSANFDPATCGTPTPVAGLRIYPPGQTASVVAAAVLTVCPGAATQLSINPIGS